MALTNIFSLVLGKLFSLADAREQPSEQDLAAEMRAAHDEGLRAAAKLIGAGIPRLEGKVIVLVDASGSMQEPIGDTKARYLDLAALLAAAILRRNSEAQVLAFSDDVVPCELNAQGTIPANAKQLAAIEGGGTNRARPLKALNKRWLNGELVLFLSDSDSWLDSGQDAGAAMGEWARFKRRNRRAKLVCINLQPGATTQVADQDVLNVGGYSSATFEVIARFVEGRSAAQFAAAS